MTQINNPETRSLVDIEQQAISIRSEMAAVVIVDQPSYDIAIEKRTSAVSWLKDAEAFFDPAIADAHALHKKLLAQKKTVCEPTEAAIRSINAALLKWDQEQERIRREEQRRLDEEARIKAEEEQLALAEQMEAQGADSETVDSILQAPVVVTDVVAAAPTYEKSNQVVYRDNWGGEVTDLFALVKAVSFDHRSTGYA